MSAIGYQKLSINNAYYIYDTSTNDLIKVDRVVYQIFDDYFKGNCETLINKYKNRISAKHIYSAINFIDNIRHKRGMFQPFFTKDYSLYLDKEFLQEKLSKHLSHLILNITEQCNQRCTYCIFSGNYPGQRTHNNSFMTWEIAQNSIDYFLQRARTDKKSIISFYGGEPLLNWKLVKKCINYTIKRNTLDKLVITIGTNLTLCTNDIIDFLIHNNVELFVSLDGHSSIHNRARVFSNGKETHAKVLKILRKIKEKSAEYFYNKVSIFCTFDKNNDLLEIFEYFSADFFRNLSVQINPISETGTGFYKVTKNNQRNYRRSLNILLDRYLESLYHKKPFNYPLFFKIFPNVFSVLPKRHIGIISTLTRPNHVCVPGKARLFVSSSGIFYPCDNFYPKNHDIGNYQTGIDIKKVRDLLEIFINLCEDVCQDCWAYRLCTQCFVHVLDKNRMSRKRKIENCNQSALLKILRGLFIFGKKSPNLHTIMNIAFTHV